MHFKKVYSWEAYSCASKYSFARTLNKLNEMYLQKDLKIVNFDFTYINDDSFWSSNNGDCLVLMRICFYASNLLCLSLCPLPIGWETTVLATFWTKLPAGVQYCMNSYHHCCLSICCFKVRCYNIYINIKFLPTCFNNESHVPDDIYTKKNYFISICPKRILGIVVWWRFWVWSRA